MKQKKRKTIIIVMLTLITSVISVSIAFATFSTTLVIKEKVDQVDNKKWDVPVRCTYCSSSINC